MKVFLADLSTAKCQYAMQSPCGTAGCGQSIWRGPSSQTRETRNIAHIVRSHLLDAEYLFVALTDDANNVWEHLEVINPYPSAKAYAASVVNPVKSCENAFVVQVAATMPPRVVPKHSECATGDRLRVCRC